MLNKVLQPNNSLNAQWWFRWLSCFALMGLLFRCGGYFFSALLNSQSVPCILHMSSTQIFSFLFVYCWLALKMLKEVHYVVYKELNRTGLWFFTTITARIILLLKIWLLCSTFCCYGYSWVLYCGTFCKDFYYIFYYPGQVFNYTDFSWGINYLAIKQARL